MIIVALHYHGSAIADTKTSCFFDIKDFFLSDTERHKYFEQDETVRQWNFILDKNNFAGS